MNKKAVDLILREARKLGFTVSETRNGHLRFARDGCKTVFTSGTPSDGRAAMNAISTLRRSVRGTL